MKLVSYWKLDCIELWNWRQFASSRPSRKNRHDRHDLYPSIDGKFLKHKCKLVHRSKDYNDPLTSHKIQLEQGRRFAEIFTFVHPSGKSRFLCVTTVTDYISMLGKSNGNLFATKSLSYFRKHSHEYAFEIFQRMMPNNSVGRDKTIEKLLRKSRPSRWNDPEQPKVL